MVGRPRSHDGGRRDQWDWLGGHDGEGRRAGASSEACWRRDEWWCGTGRRTMWVGQLLRCSEGRSYRGGPHNSLSTQPSQPSCAVLPAPAPQADPPSASVVSTKDAAPTTHQPDGRASAPSQVATAPRPPLKDGTVAAESAQLAATSASKGAQGKASKDNSAAADPGRHSSCLYGAIEGRTAVAKATCSGVRRPDRLSQAWLCCVHHCGLCDGPEQLCVLQSPLHTPPARARGAPSPRAKSQRRARCASPH